MTRFGPDNAPYWKRMRLVKYGKKPVKTRLQLPAESTEEQSGKEGIHGAPG